MSIALPIAKPKSRREALLLMSAGLICLAAGPTHGAALETLGPPDAVRRFTFSYDPGAAKERRPNHHAAGMLVRNALPGWLKAKAWTRRAIIAAEKDPGGDEITETAEGYRVTVSSSQGRVLVDVSPQQMPDSPPASLGIPLSRLLAGLGQAFPEREAGRGDLYSGPGSVSDRFFSDNAHATLETLGPETDLVGLRYVYALRDHDHPRATRDNCAYAVRLVRNAFPDWPEAEAWLRTAMIKVESEADSSAD